MKLLLITLLMTYSGMANAAMGTVCKGETSDDGNYEKILIKIDLKNRQLRFSTYASDESKPTSDELGPVYKIESLKKDDDITTLVASHDVIPQPGYRTTLTLTIGDSVNASGSSHIHVDQEGMVHGHPVNNSDTYGITCR